MDTQLVFICLLTFSIHAIGALAYAARIAGVRTRRIAISFALFNVLVLASRLSNSLLGPFLAKRIEQALATGQGGTLLGDFRMVLMSATAATIAGTLLVPTAQRWFCTAIQHFQHHRSLGRLLLRTATPSGLRCVRASGALPRPSHIRQFGSLRGLPLRVIGLNVLAQALLTVGVIASLYAGYLFPEYRVTASQLSAVVNGAATLLLFILIDPQLSVMTDDVVAGSIGEGQFRRTVVWLSASRICGTILAQALLLPSAWLVVYAAERI